MNRTSIAISGLAAALCVAATSGVNAQSLVATDAVVLAYSEGPVPGLPPLEHFAYQFDLPVLAEDGTVLFRGQMEGGSITAANSRALFQGTTAANLSMMARWSAPAPGLPGLNLTNSNGTGGIGSGYRLSPDGRTLWPSVVWGAGSTTANDSALFGGLPGSLTLVAREGNTAPGTAGAVYSGSFQTGQYMAINRNGRVVFQAGLAGGDTTPSNNAALFTGPIGAVGMMLRLGDTMLPGITFLGGAAIYQMDNNGRVLFDATLAGAGVGPSNNWSLWLHTPGAGRTMLVREGSSAPGTAGATFNNAANNWWAGINPTSLTRSGKYLFTSDLQNGDAVPGKNDRALYTASTGGGTTMVFRQGDPAPGTDTSFLGANPFYSTINDAGRVLIQAQLMVGGSATDLSNDNGYWTGTPGNLVLVARAGDPAPGTQGARFARIIAQAEAFNDLGQIVFLAELTGGDTKINFSNRGMYAWDPVKGLFLLARTGEPVEVAPGDFRTPYAIGFERTNNTDGAAQGFGKNGVLAFLMSIYPQGGAVAKVDLNCYPVYYPDADHDGYGNASSTNGVCSNASPPAGWAPNHTDCNDASPAVYATYYRDIDGDGYGNASVRVCDDATPPTGYVRYGTDCNDANLAIRPDRSDETCNAVDENCNGVADDGYGNFEGIRDTTCGLGACMGSGASQCANGFEFVLQQCVAQPGNASPESCNNGIDDDCDGTVDDPIPTGTPTVALSKLAGGVARLTWTPVGGATGYDVARGSLQVLASSHGNFIAATNACLGNNLGATTLDDTQPLPQGQGYWYVLRATGCGNGSYDSGSARQVGSRGAEIAQSTQACP